MKNNMSATEVLEYLIRLLETNLSELASAEHKNRYVLGSWEACVECLEIISFWERAKEYDLNYDPEIKFKMCCDKAAFVL